MKIRRYLWNSIAATSGTHDDHLPLPSEHRTADLQYQDTALLGREAITATSPGSTGLRRQMVPRRGGNCLIQRSRATPLRGVHVPYICHFASTREHSYHSGSPYRRHYSRYADHPYLVGIQRLSSQSPSHVEASANGAHYDRRGRGGRSSGICRI